MPMKLRDSLWEVMSNNRLIFLNFKNNLSLYLKWLSQYMPTSKVRCRRIIWSISRVADTLAPVTAFLEYHLNKLLWSHTNRNTNVREELLALAHGFRRCSPWSLNSMSLTSWLLPYHGNVGLWWRDCSMEDCQQTKLRGEYREVPCEMETQGQTQGDLLPPYGCHFLSPFPYTNTLWICQGINLLGKSGP